MPDDVGGGGGEGGGKLGFLKKKAGPLPVWGWAVAGGLLLGLMLYLRSRASASSSTGSPTAVGTPVGSGATGFTADQLGQLQGLINGSVASAMPGASTTPAPATDTGTTSTTSPAVTNPLAQFVNAEFGNLLGRPADAGGSSYWANQLAGGQSSQQQFLAIESSPEAAARAQSDASGFVQGQYEQLLGRQADAGGLAYWTGVLNANHGNAGQESAQFLQAAQPELKAKA